MLSFNKDDNEEKQKLKKAEKILKEEVGGLMPTSARRKFFSRMMDKGIIGIKQEKVRREVLKTIKKEVVNNELEPTGEEINKRIEQILNENSNPEVIEQWKEKRLKREMEKEEKRLKRENEKEEKQLKLQRKIEEKYGIELTNKKWFKCTIEEVRYGTFTNDPQRDLMDAYVIINEDNFEILKESMFIKSNMGSRKLYFHNITSLDFDARGKFNFSSSVVINTKSKEHIVLKHVREYVEDMNTAYASYIEKTSKIQENNSTTTDADELLKYAELYEKGFLTEEEFNMKKAELLKKH